MSGQRPNVDLLRQTLAHIEAHPEGWYQKEFRCRSGMCFAGWSAELSGGLWAFGPGDYYADLLRAESDDPPEDVQVVYGQHVVSAHQRAARLLGLEFRQSLRLFVADNKLPDLRRIVGELCSEVES